MDKVRVDKWLWATRMFKTRSMAASACSRGHVKINGKNAKPASLVVVGDSVVAETPGGFKVLQVARLSDKRGPATVAQTLYVDHSPPPAPKDPSDPSFDRGSHQGRKGARLTKKDRRKFDRDRGR